MNDKELKEKVKDLQIIVDEEMFTKLKKYAELLKIWNKKFNLTRIIENNDINLKHFYDSLCIQKAINLYEYNNLVDFGTGAGFPGMVLAIFFKNLKVDLIESNTKKCLFLNEIKENLLLENVNIINKRAEDYSKENREKYDIATCRAVSHLSTIIELSVPMIKINGFFVPLKGEIKDEIEESKSKIKEIGIKIEKIINYKLPIENSTRNIIILKKIAKTDDKYPREYNKIIKDLKNVKK